MKNIDLVYNLLIDKEKLNLTYKEISIKTGYHSKYLIRMNNRIKKGIDIRCRKRNTKPPYNKKAPLIKEAIINLYKSNDLSRKELYENINKDYDISYSRMCYWLKDMTKKDNKQLLILKIFYINNTKYYVGIDYESENILAIIKNNDSNLINWLRLMKIITSKYGIPEYLCDKGLFTHNDSYSLRICNDLNIKKLIINDYQKLIRKIRKKLINNTFKSNDIKYSTFNYDERIFYLEKKCKLINNTFQFSNKRYLVITDDKLPHIINVCYDIEGNNILVKYNNKYYQTKVTKVVESYKGLSKY